MKKQQSSIDGFVPRRVGSQLGDLHSNRRSAVTAKPVSRSFGAGENSHKSVTRAGIDESLRAIDSPQESSRNNKRRQTLVGGIRPRRRVRSSLKWLIIILIVAAIGVVVYVGSRGFLATNKIFQGNVLDILQNQPLKKDAHGRSNFLVLGTTDDDPNHAGGYLTDSMMVLSVDQANKNAYIFSVPRDLYVKYGMSCVSGNEGKINVYFSCVNGGSDDQQEKARLQQTQTFIGNIFGLDIQYGIHVNSTVLRQAVDAVGGVDVNIQGSNGEPGILDRNFDWGCRYTCYKVKYDNGVHHLTGEQASYLSMARGDYSGYPTYGLANSNFDREKNQQKIVLAIKDKAISTGTLTNLSAITKLIDSLGNNLRTNIETKEIRSLMQLGQDVKPQDIHSISLYDGSNAVVTTGNYNNASVVKPSAGMFIYSGIQAYIQKSITNNPVSQEAASVVIYNGSGVAGAAQQEADTLTKQGFTITDVANAPKGTYDNIEVYQIGTGMTATRAKLQSLYNVTIKTTTPPVTVPDGTNFIVVIGTAHSTTTQ